MGAAIADIDRDGRPDVISGRAWYRNAPDGTWPRHPLTTLAPAVDTFFADHSKVSVLDLDGDGRLDVFATIFADSRESKVFAFLAPPDPVAQDGRRSRSTPARSGACTARASGDFDGSARVQIMVGEPYSAGSASGATRRRGLRLPPARRRERIARHGRRRASTRSAPSRPQVVDVDGDGFRTSWATRATRRTPIRAPSAG
jgi:hypothetical protein